MTHLNLTSHAASKVDMDSTFVATGDNSRSEDNFQEGPKMDMRKLFNYPEQGTTTVYDYTPDGCYGMLGTLLWDLKTTRMVMSNYEAEIVEYRSLLVGAAVTMRETLLHVDNMGEIPDKRAIEDYAGDCEKAYYERTGCDIDLSPVDYGFPPYYWMDKVERLINLMEDFIRYLKKGTVIYGIQVEDYCLSYMRREDWTTV